MKTKLEPMRRPLEIARSIPTIWKHETRSIHATHETRSSALALRFPPTVKDADAADDDAEAAADDAEDGEGAMVECVGRL